MLHKSIFSVEAAVANQSGAMEAKDYFKNEESSKSLMSRGCLFRKVFFAFLSLLLFSSCQNNDRIIGSWERYGDDWAGMKVKVVKEGEHLKGMVIFVTEANKLGGFAEGDVKWKSMKRMDRNKYEYEDLLKSVDRLGTIIETRYDLMNLELVSENEVSSRAFAQGDEWIGTEQKWRRIIE